MFIVRNKEKIKESSMLVQIELTNAEIEQAFRIRELEYRNQDIQDTLQSMYESDSLTEEQYIVFNNEVMIREISNRYDKICNCNIAYNVTMLNAIKYVLQSSHWKMQ